MVVRTEGDLPFGSPAFPRQDVGRLPEVRSSCGRPSFGRTIRAEMPNPRQSLPPLPAPSNDSKASPVLLHLDQNSWTDLSLETGRVVREYLLGEVFSGRLLAPIETARILETLKAPPQTRHRLAKCMLELSQGWCVVNPAIQWRIEYEDHKQSTRTTGPRLLTDKPWLLLMSDPTGPPGLNIDHPLKAIVRMGDENGDTTAAWQAELEPTLRLLTDGLNAHGATMFSAETIEKHIGLDAGVLPTDAKRLGRVFPSLLMTLGLQKTVHGMKQSRMKVNDLVDTSVARLLPYFDVVTVDKATAEGIRQMRSPLKRAAVVPKFAMLRRAIEDALNSRSTA